MSSELKQIIKREQRIYDESTNPNEKIGIIYNLILIKKNILNPFAILGLYRDIKLLINDYINLAKINDYGYDYFCKEKILTVISFLSLHEQHSILIYLLSALSREFPEIDKEWVQIALNKVKLKIVVKEKKIWQLPYAFLLFSSLSVSKLLIALSIFVALVSIVLLPAPFGWMEVFKVKLVSYSTNSYVNYMCNIFSLFGELKNACEVTAINTRGLLFQIIGKITFMILIINFVYKKISDKITII